jgi:predicted transcriptional regulator
MPRRAAREIPPPLELECLAVLWRLGESNVRTVQEALAGRRPLAYTTVMTMLERLARKQLVTRRKTGRHFVYTPEVDRDTVRHHALRQLLDALFDGSREELVGFLNADAGLMGASALAATVSPATGAGIQHPEGDGSEIDAVLL